MTLDPARWTTKTREAFQAANTQAAAAGNPYVTPSRTCCWRYSTRPTASPARSWWRPASTP